MSFLYPVFLLGALAIAIPIVLHLLRRDEAPEVPFTAVRLLRRSPIERSRRRRLRDLLLLAARVTALLLLALAFARPYTEHHTAASGPLRIVAVDRSLSMAAPGVFDRARTIAREAIDAAAAGERVALVAFDDRAEIVSAPGAAADARTALAALAPAYGGARYPPVVAAAVELAGGAPGTLVLVTDLQRAGWEGMDPATIPDTLRLDLRPIDGPAVNLAVVDLRSDDARVVAAVRNDGPEERRGTLQIAAEGIEPVRAEFNVPAGGTVDVPVDVRAPHGAALVASLEDTEGYPADNSRYALAGPAPLGKVLIVAGEAAGSSGFYLSRALAVSAEEEDGFEADVVSGRAFSAMAPADVHGHAAVVLLSTRGLDRRARDMLLPFVRGGGGLVLAAGGGTEPQLLSMLVDLPLGPRETDSVVSLAVTDPRHPVFLPFGSLAANLGHVRFQRTWRLDGTGWDVVASFSDGSPALLERQAGNGRIVLFASDLDRQWNDFPLHPAFVPFAVETIRHAAGPREGPRSVLVHDVPVGVPPVPGLHSAGATGRIVAVNVDPRESPLGRMEPGEFLEMVETVPAAAPVPAVQLAQEAENAQSLWRYGLLLMLCALALESVIGRSR